MGSEPFASSSEDPASKQQLLSCVTVNARTQVSRGKRDRARGKEPTCSVQQIHFIRLERQSNKSSGGASLSESLLPPPGTGVPAAAGGCGACRCSSAACRRAAACCFNSSTRATHCLCAAPQGQA
jgi:hypothetical protein